MVHHGLWKQKLTVTVLVVIRFYYVTAAAMPLSDCYALDRNGYLYDFTDKIGKELEFSGHQGSDLVVRFCEDVQNRSQSGYVNYGRFLPQNTFTKGSDEIDFLQVYRYGDLIHCEHNGYNLMGREAEVNIICGSCSGVVSCKDDFGCVCNVSYRHNLCRAQVVVAINCSDPGSRVLPGFSVGFNPEGWEVVNNGITQLGFYRPFHDHRFGTEQTSLSLYLTAASSLSTNVGKPHFQVTPANGLSVKLSGTAATGAVPTAEAPTILEVNWQCEISREDPYEVSITIPLEGYDPIVFFLCKLCENQKKSRSTGSSDWATFGLLSFMVLGIVFCCATFLFKTRVQNKHDLGPFPGLGLLSNCLVKNRDACSSCHPINQVSNVIGAGSWDGIQFSNFGSRRITQVNYGTL